MQLLLAPSPPDPASRGLSPVAQSPGRLADLDQVAVGVAHVAADLPAVVLGRVRNTAPLARHC